MRSALAGVAVLSAFALAACGGDADGESKPSDEEQARAAVEQFAAAWERGDGGKACSLLHPRDARAFNVPCARYFSETSERFKGLRVGTATVSRTQGVVNVRWLHRRNGQPQLNVVRVDDEWLVAFGSPHLVESPRLCCARSRLGRNRRRQESAPSGDPEARSGPTKLASLTLNDGRKIVLGARGGKGPSGGSPCLTLSGIGETPRQCGNAPSERVPSKASTPILAESFAKPSPSAPLEVYGTARADVARVILEYGADRRRMSAVLLEVSNEGTLKRAHIHKPFGFFFGELPSKTSLRSVRAIGLNSEGQTLGSGDFGFMHDMHPEAFIAGPE